MSEDSASLGRRRFLRLSGAALASGIAARHLVGCSSEVSTASARSAIQNQRDVPNIILITTDQEHVPMWFGDADLDSILPARAFLRRFGVSFENAHCNTVACSPARVSLYTGLHPYQTHIYGNTGFDGNFLQPGFPTIARILRHLYGYQTTYIGKVHFATMSEYWCSQDRADCALEGYGFDRWTTASVPPYLPATGRPLSWPEDRCYDSPGIPNEGGLEDVHFTEAAVDWFRGIRGAAPLHGFDGPQFDPMLPWFTVVSLVNPHDIAFFPKYAQAYCDAVGCVPPQNRSRMQPLPLEVPHQDHVGNFEPTQLASQNKPSCQREYRKLINRVFGEMPHDYRDPSFQLWNDMVTIYLQLLRRSDRALTQTLREVLRMPREVRQKTVLLFTSDHGEMLGSHGLRGKGCNLYDEQMRVPLCFLDFSHGALDAIDPESVGDDDGFLGLMPDEITPGMYLSSVGEVRRSLVSHFDLTATIAALAANERSEVVVRSESEIEQAWRSTTEVVVDKTGDLSACQGDVPRTGYVVTTDQIHGRNLLHALNDDTITFGAEPIEGTERFRRTLLLTSSSNWVGQGVSEPYHIVGIREQVVEREVILSDYKLNLYYAWKKSPGLTTTYRTGSAGHGPSVDWQRPHQVELYDMIHTPVLTPYGWRFPEPAAHQFPHDDQGATRDPRLHEVNNLLPVHYPSIMGNPRLRRLAWSSMRWIVCDDDGHLERSVLAFDSATRSFYQSLFVDLWDRLQALIPQTLEKPLPSNRLTEVQKVAWRQYNDSRADDVDDEIASSQ